MSFTYSGNPSESEVEAIRFLIGDTEMEEPLLTDEEITYLSSLWTLEWSVYWTAAMACDAIAAKFAREVTFNSDSQTISTSELQQKYLTMAEKLRALHHAQMAGGFVDVGGITKGELLDPTVLPLAFGRGMHDDIEAGNQDLGNYRKHPPVGGYDELLGY